MGKNSKNTVEELWCRIVIHEGEIVRVKFWKIEY